MMKHFLIIVLLAVVARFALTSRSISHDVRADELEFVGEIGQGSWEAWDVAGYDDYAYVIEDPAGTGLRVVDISDPGDPELVKTLPMGGSGITVEFPYVYIASMSDGLVIVDISDPSDPEEIENYDISGARSVDVVNEHAFLVGDFGLRIINVSKPSNPTLVGYSNSSESYLEIAVDNGYAFVAAGNVFQSFKGLRIFDIGDVANPQEVAALPLSSSDFDIAEGLAIADKIVYVSTWETGIHAINVTIPENPYVASSVNPAGTQRGLAAVSDYLYAGKDPISLFDTSDPGQLNILDTYNATIGARGIDVLGNLVLVAEESDGLTILRHTPSNASIRQDGELVVSGYLAEDGVVFIDIPVRNYGSTTSVALHAYIEGSTSEDSLWRADGAVPTAVTLDPGERVVFRVKHILWWDHAGIWNIDGVYLWNDAADDYISELSPNGYSQNVEFYVEELIDSDGDTIPDFWESHGLDADHDGQIDVHLPAIGADPNIRDLFLEVDYMVVPDSDCFFSICTGGHTHQPTQRSIDMIVEAFDERGIRLHVDFGDEALLHPSVRTDEISTWGDIPGGSEAAAIPEIENLLGEGYLDFEHGWGPYKRIEKKNFPPERENVFYYALMVHGVTGAHVGTHGLAPTPGSDIIVGLRDDRGTFYTASALMHELGHSLGLCHEGPVSEIGACSEYSVVPNQLSIMSYAYTERGLRQGTRRFIDYADDTRVSPPLHENNLMETEGLNHPPLDGYFVQWWCSPLPPTDLGYPANTWIDWNCDTFPDFSPIQADINRDQDTTDILHSYDEWSSIIFGGGDVGLEDRDSRSSPMIPFRSPGTMSDIVEDAFPGVSLAYELEVEASTVVVGEPAQSLTIPVTITSTGHLTTTIFVSETLDSLWFDVVNPPPATVLQTGQSVSFEIALNIPSDATPGHEERFGLLVGVSEDEAASEEIIFRAISEPYAWFDAVYDSGTPPLVVTFEDLSIGDIDTWQWDFGDGQTSSEQNPTHVYQTPGAYTVQLTISGSHGTDSYTREKVVIVERFEIFLPIIR